MNIVIVDVETTGLDPATCRVIELGAVLYSTADRCVISSFSTLAQSPDNAAESINRIPVSAVVGAPTVQFAWKQLAGMVDWATAGTDAVFMAHRAEFDRGFIAASAPKLAERLNWVCSKNDVEWPASKLGASCVEMALAHGVPVVSAHRALTDCMLIANTLAAVQKTHDLDALIARAMRPKALFAVADRTFDEARNAQAREAGFRFIRERGRWEKRMAVEATTGLPFAVEQVA